MARFRGSIKGSGENTSTRNGNAQTGMQAHLRGWDTGVRVILSAKSERAGSGDTVRVYRTGGSNGETVDTLIAEWIVPEPAKDA